ncbi:hypothetical protein PHET_03990, partial [Paragonimus heterotremus]
NFTGRAILECVGSCLTNKYTEGLPFKRLPRGTHFIDQIESMAQSRLLELFKLKHPEQPLDACEWGVNVQPLSGSPANLAVYTALLQPHDGLMGLEYAAGGHVSHGLATASKKLSAASIFFNSLPYKLDPKSETIDYDALESDAARFLPKMIIAGVSTHPRLLDYARFRKASEPHFVEYASQVLSNCKTLAKALISRGVHLTSGGTDIHFMVVDLCASKITPVLGAGDASRVQVVADACGITFSAVPVPTDSDWSNPSGIRIGTPALTSRGFREEDFGRIALFIEEVMKISAQTKIISSSWDSLPDILHNNQEISDQIAVLRKRVYDLAMSFPMPGFEDI